MRFGITSVLTGVALLLAGMALPAAAVPVEVKLTSVRAIQTYTTDKKGNDTAYLLVNGVAKGQAMEARYPKEKTWEAGPKKAAVTEKAPISLWTGDLADGEFALVTVIVMQGKGEDAAKNKAFVASLTDAAKKVAELGKKTLTADDAKALTAGVLKGQREVITKVKDTYAREKNTDHFGGLFNVFVWNNGGTITKRLDPVGLTFGEDFGTDVKIYTKLKNTRDNVFVQADSGEWSAQSLAPVSDDQETVRVKMLETEFFKIDNREVKNITDYLADIQVLADGKAQKWTLGGEQPGPDEIHVFWDFAQ
jgi:hypothetical protein